jgi:hypothetical protein
MGRDGHRAPSLHLQGSMPNVSGPRNRAPDQQEHYRADERDDDTPYVDPRYCSQSQGAEDPSAYQRADDSCKQVAEDPSRTWLCAGYHRPREEPGNQSNYYPSKYAHNITSESLVPSYNRCAKAAAPLVFLPFAEAPQTLQRKNLGRGGNVHRDLSDKPASPCMTHKELEGP